MTRIEFQPLHPGLDPATTVMIDGYDPRFRMISHWPGHRTSDALRHDLTTGSALLNAMRKCPIRVASKWSGIFRSRPCRRSA